MTHLISVHEYEMSPCKIFGGTEYSKEAVSLQFTFDESWDGYPTRKITFHPPRRKPVVIIIPSTGIITVSEEITARSAVVGFVVTGYSASTPMKVSIPGVLDVRATLNPNGSSADTPTQSEIQQVYSYMQTAVDAANSVVTRANNGEFDGEKGDAFTYSDFTAAQLEALTGPAGADGQSFVVKSIYATLSALQTAHPTGTTGDAYAVGTDEANVVYLWDTDASAWSSVGSLKGEKGDKGDKGDPADLAIATDTILGGIKVGENLKIDENGVLSVDTATDVEQDNTKPVTSAAVHVQLGNVETLLAVL